MSRGWSVFACLLFGWVVSGGCAAGGGEDDEASIDEGGDPFLPLDTGGQDGTDGSGDPLVLGNGSGASESGTPFNVGSEQLCDGIDENDNGVIDDVDIGRDGLCDCLRIGFLGELASDAGNQTGAFQAWLEERSDVPVTLISAQQELSEQVFGDLQVIVVGNLAQRANSGGYSAAEVAALEAWTRAGGGLMTLAGYSAREADIVPTVQLLEPYGVSYDYQGRGPGVLGMGAPPVLVNILPTPEHPSVDGIAAMGVYNAYPVTGVGEVIFSDGSFDLARALTVDEGRVFAFSDEWITQDALWLPGANMRPLTPCQQACNQCEMQCSSCESQCLACSMEPCQGGQEPAEGETCARGCDQACASCSSNCSTCTATCDACSANEVNEELDVPRFWLNVMRWLTPANECQVPIPTVLR